MPGAIPKQSPSGFLVDAFFSRVSEAGIEALATFLKMA
jgi:hypothetical protein